MERPTPRVNSTLLNDYIGQTVRLIGKLERMGDDNSATVIASDKGEVTINLGPNHNLTDTFVEIIGRVNQDSSIQEHTSVNFGDKLDLDLVEEALQLTHRFPQLFADSS
ncbi:replication factor A protein 3 [Meredithblackwellia eburnea MCA 4105]